MEHGESKLSVVRNRWEQNLLCNGTPSFTSLCYPIVLEITLTSFPFRAWQVGQDSWKGKEVEREAKDFSRGPLLVYCASALLQQWEDPRLPFGSECPHLCPALSYSWHLHWESEGFMCRAGALWLWIRGLEMQVHLTSLSCWTWVKRSWKLNPFEIILRGEIRLFLEILFLSHVLLCH